MDDREKTQQGDLPSWSEVGAAADQALFRALIGGLPLGVAVIETRTGSLVYVNDALARILCIEADGAIGTSYLEHVAPEDRERIRDYHRRRILGDPTLPTRYEMLLTTPGDERRVVELVAGPIRFSDTLMLLMRDVTEQKLYHEPLVHMQKIEGLSDLVGRIAHEFNNLLASILGHTSLLRSRVRDDADLEPLVRRVEGAAQKAREVLGELLELGGGRGSFFDRIPGEVLEDRLKQVLEGMRAPKGPGIVLEVPEEPWPIRGDLNLLTQAVFELISNGVDAAGPGGRIRVGVANLDLSEHTEAPPGAPPGEVIAISVEDDGPGIPLELRRRVVEPYFSTREEARHDGLGLTKVFHVEQELEGAMEIGVSALGGGRVTLYIPRGPHPDANLPALLEADPAGGEVPLVLVVDDQDYIGEMIEQMLETRRIAVRCILDPVEALSAIEAGEVLPDLLIVDVRMPGMDGRELVLRLRRSAPDLPIVMTSGFTGVTAMDDEVAGLISGFLKKPFTVKMLLALVLPLLGRTP